MGNLTLAQFCFALAASGYKPTQKTETEGEPDTGDRAIGEAKERLKRKYGGTRTSFDLAEVIAEMTNPTGL